MAKIKIREGSLKVDLHGKNGNHYGGLDDPGFKKGERVKIDFVTHGTRYAFVEGVLVSASVDVSEFVKLEL